MSTKTQGDDAELKAIKPHPERLKNSQQARQARRAAASAKQRITIRLDEDILAEFRALATEDGNYQTLINLALRQWLEAQGLKELLRQDLPELVRDALQNAAPLK